MQEIKLSPVVMFVHSRLEHTQRTIQSLSECYLSDMTELIIYSDGPRNLTEQENVDKIRLYLKSVSGFKSIKVIEREHNYGLAKNIFSGISDVLTVNDTVIVLEDDMLVSRSFLKFMNYNLDRFATHKSVWQISAWVPDVTFFNHEHSNDTLYLTFSQLMPCWGWATWKDRWLSIELDIDSLVNRFSLKDKYIFNLGMKYPFYSHLIGNLIKTNSTWAVYWYASAFLSGGKSIVPTKPLVLNIGSDGSGSHNSIKIYQTSIIHDYDDVVILDELSASVFIRMIKRSYGKGLSMLQFFSMYFKVFVPYWVWKKFK